MQYDDSEVPKSAPRATAGVYAFTVEDATDETFRSGNDGVKLTLATEAFPDRNVRVFCNLVTVKNALWKVKQFLDSVGMPFSPPPDTNKLVGLRGSARYIVNDKGYLEVDEFLPAPASNGPDGLPF